MGIFVCFQYIIVNVRKVGLNGSILVSKFCLDHFIFPDKHLLWNYNALLIRNASEKKFSFESMKCNWIFPFFKNWLNIGGQWCITNTIPILADQQAIGDKRLAKFWCKGISLYEGGDLWWCIHCGEDWVMTGCMSYAFLCLTCVEEWVGMWSNIIPFIYMYQLPIVSYIV